jgi:hypothetical protein
MPLEAIGKRLINITLSDVYAKNIITIPSVRYNLPQVGAHWDKDPFHNF